jgi:hypothetical protein
MKIKPDMLEKIKGNLGLRKKIMTTLDVTRTTLWKYLDENDDNLTKASALNVIAEHYNLQPYDLLEEVVEEMRK